MRTKDKERPVDRVVLLVLDSCGCGAAPDAERYGDSLANTLGNLSRRVGGLDLPNLGRLGLGNVTPIVGVPPTEEPLGAWGRLREASAGKDTTTGHWEIAGLLLPTPFPTFPEGFPPEFIGRFSARTRRGVLGNIPASGTQIIEEFGEEHLRTGAFIVYTSADSVFQVAAHEEVVPLQELYRACSIARELCDEYGVGRVIARPFVGEPGRFRRTYNRKDFSLPPPTPTVLDRIAEDDLPVIGIGKISDIFAGRGVTEEIHTEGNLDGMARTLEALTRTPAGLLFCNLVDFDMLYGHRRDVEGYARALAEFDEFLPRLLAAMGPRDLLLMTADHGNDPTHPGTDHTREDVPILAVTSRPPLQAELGVRAGFYDVAQTLCQAFALPAWERGQGFLGHLLA